MAKFYPARAAVQHNSKKARSRKAQRRPNTRIIRAAIRHILRPVAAGQRFLRSVFRNNPTKMEFIPVRCRGVIGARSLSRARRDGLPQLLNLLINTAVTAQF